MRRVWGLKIVSCFGVFLILYSVHIVRTPKATADAYKLGKVYANCLEGYSGQVSSSTGCSCINDKECQMKGLGYVCNNQEHVCQECGTDTHCEKIYGDPDYICMNGGCTLAECQVQEDCTEKYGHLHSCNTGNKRCYISCNAQILEDSGYNKVTTREGTVVNIAQHLANMRALTTANRTAINYFARTAPKGELYTCYQGKPAPCVEVGKSGSASNVGLALNDLAVPKDSVCLPCSIESGGTYGVGADANPLNVGSRPYYTNGCTVVAYHNGAVRSSCWHWAFFCASNSFFKKGVSFEERVDNVIEIWPDLGGTVTNNGKQHYRTFSSFCSYMWGRNTQENGYYFYSVNNYFVFPEGQFHGWKVYDTDEQRYYCFSLGDYLGTRVYIDHYNP